MEGVDLRNRNLAGADLSAAQVPVQETSTRYRAVEPEQWLQRRPEVGSS